MNNINISMAIFLISILPTNSIAGSQLDYCGLIIQEKAFNTRDVTSKTDTMALIKDNLCNSEYTDEREATNAVRGSGFNVGYNGFSLGGTSSSGASSGRVSIKNTEFCSLSNREFKYRLEMSENLVDANAAVRAWSMCIKELGGDSMYLQYTLAGDGNGIIGDLLWSKNNGAREIKAVDMIKDENTSFECNILGNTIKEGKLSRPIVVDTQSTGVSCRRGGDGYAAVQFQTTSGSTGYIEILSNKDKKRIEIEGVISNLALLSEKVDAIEERMRLFATRNDVVKDMASIRDSIAKILPFRTKKGIIFTDAAPDQIPNSPGVRREGKFYVLDLIPEHDGVCFITQSGDSNRPNIGLQKIIVIENGKWVLKATRDNDVGFGFVEATCLMQN